MNTQEKKIIYRFIIVYLLISCGLAFFLSFMMTKLNYRIAINACQMRMYISAISIKSNILEALAYERPYRFIQPKVSDNYELVYALVGENNRYIYNDLKEEAFVNKQLSNYQYQARTVNGKITDNELFYPSAFIDFLRQKKFNPKLIMPIEGGDIRYIVVENLTPLMPLKKVYTELFTYFASIFFVMGLIGLVLVRLFIQPIKLKNAQINQFLHATSHEANTPIAAISMALNMLKIDPTNQNMLKHISISVKNIKQVYDRLIFTISSQNPIYTDEVFDLKKVVQESATYFEEIAMNEDITLQVTTKSLPVFMDKSRCKILINNLISNAIKYSEPKSRIYVSMYEHQLFVRDEGAGIPRSMQKLIFKKNVRNNHEKEGFGLGLYIVKSTCKAYGIKIMLQSKLNEGSEFILDFTKAMA